MNLKDYLSSKEQIQFTKDERFIRKMISELSKEGIIFIPIEARTYRRIDLCSDEEIENYYLTQLKSMNTQYFQRLKPIANHIKKERLNALHEGTLFERGTHESK